MITGLGMGGAEHVVVNLADELIKLGHTVKIAYLSGSVLVSPKRSEIELIPIGMRGTKDFLKAFFKLRNIVKDFKPDVVHSHMFHSNIISRLIRLAIYVPKLICTVHSSNEGGKFRMLAYRLTDSLADISTNVSQQSVNDYINKGAAKYGRMVSIANGIDTEKFRYNAVFRESLRSELCVSSEKIILAIGRLHVAKDYQNLLYAVDKLKTIRTDFKVFIVGEGLLENDLKKITKEKGIEHFISFLGVRRDIKELMSAADIYVMSSAWEGLPMVILEAMACERFVVTTDCGGIRGVVGSNGFIVEPKNYTALADRLNDALDMTFEERFSIGKLARKSIVNNYSLSANVDAYLELYLG